VSTCVRLFLDEFCISRQRAHKQAIEHPGHQSTAGSLRQERRAISSSWLLFSIIRTIRHVSSESPVEGIILYNFEPITSHREGRYLWIKNKNFLKFYLSGEHFTYDEEEQKLLKVFVLRQHQQCLPVPAPPCCTSVLFGLVSRRAPHVLRSLQ
jgi:hypothetical protein